MTPELGHYALILAMCCTLLLSVVPMVGSYTGQVRWMAFSRPAALLQGFFVLLAYACLTWSFIESDFSVLYVANTSNLTMPLIYKISAVWGGHEGSVLLWVLILTLWTAAVALMNRQLPLVLNARVLSVLGMITAGFISFILLTSNPFERLFPFPTDGASLNPLLQDPGMALHPPMLYMGYVGFSVAFAFAIAAMLSGSLDSATLRWMRPWTNIAWVFLTLGIALGSYWAYYELGWGGWWFWDPVENASFMPWLAGTALVHSLAASEKRGVFKAWTVLLAVMAFSLSLLGTFLVRSGVLTSVHAFASDPTRGLFVLLFLMLVVGSSLLLFAVRAGRLTGVGGYELLSRESGILLNNVLMVVACASVLLGTLFPLVLDALGLGKISVGPPYFNTVFIPLMVPVGLFVGIGSWLNWKRDNLSKYKRELILAVIVVVMASAMHALVLPHFSLGAMASLGLAVWIVTTSVLGVLRRLRNRRDKMTAIAHTPASFWGMIIAHIGIAVFTVGVAMTSIYGVQRDIRMGQGDSESINEYRFEFNGTRDLQGPNYQATRADVSVYSGDELVATLYPEKRMYDRNRNIMTEAGIDATLARDLFVALGNPRGGGAWEVRLYVKPYIRLIWLGSMIMALGGLIAVVDRRYRLKRQVRQTTGDKTGLGQTA